MALIRPVVSRAAWRGAELFDRDDWLIDLSTEEIDEVELALRELCSIDKSFFMLEKPDFPWNRLSTTLANFQQQLETGSGACRIRGLRCDGWSHEDAMKIFWGITNEVGVPVSQSAAGDLIFSVRDEGHGPDSPETRGPNTRKKLSFHTDRCDVIAFLCLNQARQGGENQLVSSVTLYNELYKRRPDLAQVLCEPFYYKRHNVDVGNSQPWCLQPVFSMFEGHFAASFLRVLIERAYQSPELPDMTERQVEALDYLEQLAADPSMHVTFRLEPGEMLFLNNWVTFHRRTEFQDYAEPERKRHLLRAWLSVPNSRPLDPAFESNFGSTRAGAIRGGMQPLIDQSPGR